MFPLYLIFHVKVYPFYLSLVRVCTKKFIYKLIAYQQGCVLSLLIKFDITTQKGEKELKGIFLISLKHYSIRTFKAFIIKI
jgi:hypothetical protein